MDIKKLLEQVRSQLDGETAEKVNSVLKEIETGVVDIVDSLKAANSESKSRKLKIRDLEEKISDYEVQVEKLQKESDTTELTKELESLKAFKSEVITRQRESFTNRFKEIKSHKNFEKAAKLFTLPEPDKDGEYDFSKLEDSDFDRNIQKLNELDALDYFGEQSKKSVDGKKTDQSPADISERISGAKTIEELEAIQDEM